MRVGVPKEIKIHEYRVGLTPGTVREYVAAGHSVVVETKEDRFELDISCRGIRFLLGFSRIESVRLLGNRHDGDKTKHNEKEDKP